MAKQHYNVFLNYRRDPGRDFARTLQQAFKARGLSVFFDYDSLQDGKFNEEIYSAIENCDVFVISYSEGSLNRCRNDGDWVRIEIEHAFKHGKKIVPVAQTDLLAHLTFPADLPHSLSALRNIQITEIHPGKYFDHSIDDCISKRFPKGLVSARSNRPEHDKEEAERLFREAQRLEDGVECPCDLARSFDCYLAAAELGHPEAQYFVGTAYEEGWGGRIPELDYAVEWWEKAARGGAPDAMWQLARLHEEGEGVEKDDGKAEALYKRAFSIWRKKAEGDDPRAQWRLAECYALGRGTRQNPQLAAVWYTKAAENNCIWAMDIIASGLVEDIGEEERAKWYSITRLELSKRAEMGNPWCQFSLALMCSETFREYEENDEKVAKWFKMAADNGHRGAMRCYGLVLLKGEGVEIDYGGAYDYLRKAIALGDKEALFEFGLCQLLGLNGNAGNVLSAVNTWITAEESFGEEGDDDTDDIPDYARESRSILRRRWGIKERSGTEAADWLTRAACWKLLFEWHSAFGHGDAAAADLCHHASMLFTLAKHCADGLAEEDGNDAAGQLVSAAGELRTRGRNREATVCLSAVTMILGGRGDDAAMVLSAKAKLESAKIALGNKATDRAVKECKEVIGLFGNVEGEKDGGQCSGGADGTEKWLKCESHHLLGKSLLVKQDWIEAQSALKAAEGMISEMIGNAPDDRRLLKKAALISCDLASCYGGMDNRPLAYQQAGISLQKLRSLHIQDDAELKDAWSRCQEMFGKVCPFNEADVSFVSKVVKAEADGFSLLVDTGYFTDKYICDLTVSDSELSIPVFILPDGENYKPAFCGETGRKASTLEECISGDVFLLDPFIALVVESCKFAESWRVKNGHDTRCLLVCSEETIDNIRRFFDDAFESPSEDTKRQAGSLVDSILECGLEVCTCKSIFSSLAKTFNVKCAGDAGKPRREKYFVWLESMKKGTMWEKMKKVSSAVGNVGNRWKRGRALFGIHKRMDLDDDVRTQGVIIENITEKEALAVRRELMDLGALASARPMSFKEFDS